MRRFLLSLSIITIIASCSNKNSAKVSINVEGSSDSTQIVVAKLAVNKMVVVDTIALKHGQANYKTNCAVGAPDFYYFFSGESKIASVVLKGGDVIKIVTNLEGEVSEIKGSEDAEKFAEIEREGDSVSKAMYHLYDALLEAQQANDQPKVAEVSKELGQMYVKYKQSVTKYILSNPTSITIIPLVYKRLTPTLPLFGEVNDIFILKSVFDSISKVYPNSPYIIALGEDIKNRESYMEFERKVTQAQELKYPDISLYDQYGKVRSLSELDGKVIILSFWSIAEPTHKIFNAELKELYAKYSKKGLEVFQVSIDPDKTAWATIVKDQKLDWVSVIDPANLSKTLDLYNVTKVPAIYVIDKKGDIVEKNVFDIKKLEEVISKYTK